MRNDGSIALTKLNMSVIDSSALISSEALLCASFAQEIIDRAQTGQPYIPSTELDFLEENEEANLPKTGKSQVNLNYDLTFKMVVSHLQALEKEAEKEAENRRKIDKETIVKEIEEKNNRDREVLKKEITRERLLLEKSLEILEKNSIYKSSPVVKRYREIRALKEIGKIIEGQKQIWLKGQNGDSIVNREKNEIIKLVQKYNSPDIIRLSTNENEIRNIRNLRNFINDISPAKRNIILDRILNNTEEITRNNFLADNIYTNTNNTINEGLNRYDIAQLEGLTGLTSARETEELAKTTKRAVDRQIREIKNLKEILNSTDIYTPLHVNFREKKEQPGNREKESAKGVGNKAAENNIYENSNIQNIRNVLEPVTREITLNRMMNRMSVIKNGIMSGKSQGAGTDRLPMAGRTEISRILREILPEAGSSIINQIGNSYLHSEMGFGDLNIENLNISNALEEKVKESRLVSEKQIREIRELKKILGDRDIMTPLKAVKDRTDSETELKREEIRGRQNTKDFNLSEFNGRELELRKLNTKEIISRELEKTDIIEKTLKAKEATEKIDRTITGIKKIEETGKQLEENLRVTDNIRNALNPLTREIALIKLLRGNNRDELRNITKLIRSELPWNSTESANEIREKYVSRQMGYTPESLEDILLQDKEKDEEISKLMATSAKQERDIRELKQTIAAGTSDEEKRAESEKRRREKEEKKRNEAEKRKEELERSIEINERVRNALAPITREIATIKLFKGNGEEDLKNITKLVQTALPGTDTESINAIRKRYARSVMGFRPEKLENLLFEKPEDKAEPFRGGAIHERELKDLSKIVTKAEKKEEKKSEDKKNQIMNYPPISMEYGIAYPDLVKNMIGKQMEAPKTHDPLSSSEKFIRGELDETVIESPMDIRNPMKQMSHANPMQSVNPMNTMNPMPVKEQTWTNPMFSPYMNNMGEIQFKEKKKETEKKEVENRNVKLSDAEIRRTADKVFKLVEERIRKERRRIGRI